LIKNIYTISKVAVLSFLGIKSTRTKKITKQVLLSSIFKVGTIGANFLLVPLTMEYLDIERYGVWLTLSSFIAWFSFFDIGLGHGLQNKLIEANVDNDKELARGYVSSAYYTVGSLSVALFVIFLILNFFIDWTLVLNTNSSLKNDLSVLMPLVFGLFCIQLVVRLVTIMFVADQNHSIQVKIGFLVQLFSVLSVWLLIKITHGSLLALGLVFSTIPVLIFLTLNFFAFNGKYAAVKPRFEYWKKEYLKDIFGLGITFFIIQVSGVILFSTDNVIITRLFGPKEIVPYNVAFKYFSITLVLFNMILSHYWSNFTEAIKKGEFAWIDMSMKKLLSLAGVVLVIGIILFLAAPMVFELWVGKNLEIPWRLSLAMAVYFGITILYMPFTQFINATGKVRLQMYTVLIMAILNIPLSWFFAKSMNLGSTGVIVATICCMIPHLIISPIQYWKIINNKSKGIWNK